MTKEKLINRIDKALEEKAMKFGYMGTERVFVELHLSPEEKDAFKKITKYDSEHYFWEIEDDLLYISYTEEV